MTQDEIIRMARDAGWNGEGGIYSLWLRRFAARLREAEREACAKVADKYANGLERNYSEIIADAIRARGEL